MTSIGFLAEFAAVLLFAALGVAIAKRDFRRHPNRKPGQPANLRWYLCLGVPILLLLPILNIWLTGHPTSVWGMPAWLQIHYFPIYWGLICAVLGYGFGFCCSAKFLARAHGRWPLLIVAIFTISTIEGYAWWKTGTSGSSPAAAPRITPDGVILQSTGATCVPASAANIAQILGVQTSEAEMARLCCTTSDGTYPAQALAALRQIGISGRKVSNSERDILAIKPPAILFFLDDTHAVVFVGLTNGMAEIWNPSIGKTRLSPSRIHDLWTGHAFEFWRN